MKSSCHAHRCLNIRTHNLYFILRFIHTEIQFIIFRYTHSWISERVQIMWKKALKEFLVLRGCSFIDQDTLCVSFNFVSDVSLGEIKKTNETLQWLRSCDLGLIWVQNVWVHIAISTFDLQIYWDKSEHSLRHFFLNSRRDTCEIHIFAQMQLLSVIFLFGIFVLYLNIFKSR